MANKSSYNWGIFLVLVALAFVLHVKAREVPNPKSVDNNTNQNKEEIVVENTTLVNTSINNNTSAKDAPKKGDEVKDDKHFIAFAGMGAAGGVGGAAGIIPIDYNGLGTIPTFGGLGSGLGGGTGGGIGGGGIGGGAGGGCPTTSTSTTTGGLVPTHP